jgi:hypothetical protein
LSKKGSSGPGSQVKCEKWGFCGGNAHTRRFCRGVEGETLGPICFSESTDKGGGAPAVCAGRRFFVIFVSESYDKFLLKGEMLCVED